MPPDNDDNLKRLIGQYTRRLQKLKERQAIQGFSADPSISLEIEDIEQKLEELRGIITFPLQELDQGIHSYIESLQIARVQGSTVVEPYRGLLDYRLRDADLFFGRDQAIAQFMRKMEQHPLTVLHAESGAGKSSLLRAGIAPRLIAAGHIPIYIRAYSVEPTLTLRRNLVPNLDDSNPVSLRSFLWQVTRVINPRTKIYIFLDQFEEFFTQLDEATQQKFIKQLAECLDQESLKTQWVISLRAEDFSKLAGFEFAIQNPFNNQYRLSYLKRAEACEVIAEPARQCQLEFEPGLIETLLDDLAQEDFYPPHIQLVCQTLYEALPTDQKTITYQMYIDQSEVAGILKGYLDRVLGRLAPEHRSPARRLLEALIPLKGQRASYTRLELFDNLVPQGLTPQLLDYLLDQLADSRLLRLEDRTDGITYELAHEYLRQAINLDPQVQARQIVLEMLNQEVQDYQQHGMFLSRDKLEFLGTRLAPTDFKADVLELLASSAIYLDYNPDRWLAETSPDLRASILGKCLVSKDTILRRRAAALAGSFGGSTLAADLANLMSTDSDLIVRQWAALSLAQIDQVECITRLSQVLKNGSPTHRYAALEMIAYIQDEQPNLLNFHQVSGYSRLTTWRIWRLRLRHNWANVGLTTLYAASGGALAAFVGGLLGAMASLDPRVRVFAPVYATIALVIGLIIGASTGFGFGVVMVTNKHQSPVGYIVGTALFGGLFTMLFGALAFFQSASEGLQTASVTMALGIIVSFSVALIIGLTKNMAYSTQRRIVRLAFGVVIGLMSGLLLTLPCCDVLFNLPSYGYGSSALLVPGIILGLELLNKK